MLPLITGSWKQRGGGLVLSTSGAFPFATKKLQMPELMLSSPLKREARTINMTQLGEALTLVDEDVYKRQLQYGVTQHLYFRPKPARPRPGCAAVEPEASGSAEAETRDVLNPTEEGGVDANGIPNSSVMVPDAPTRTHARHDPCAPEAGAEPTQQEWFTWTVTQKFFFDQLFGGAVINQRRNIFSSTLDLSGIAFLTEPRSIAPVISRMRFRTSSHTDVGWDFDYDTGASKFNSSNVYLDAHEGRLFGGFSYAGLNAPGRFYTEVINTTNNTTGLTTSATSNFSQMRMLLGYGAPNLSLIHI